MRRGLALVLAMLLGVVGAACGESGPTPNTELTAPSTPPLTPLRSPSPTSTHYEELLGLIPDTPESRSLVWIKDYTRMRELFGIEVPGPQADEDALAAYIERLR